MKTCLKFVLCLLTINLAGIAAAQTQLVSDSFNGANGTYLGSNWTGCGYNNGVYNKLVYENNQAGGSGYWGQDCALYTGYNPFPSDQYATATIVAATPSSSPEVSIQLRGNSTPSTPESYIACGWDAQDFPADYHYRIWSLTPNPASGGPSSLFLSGVTPAINDVIWCQVLGNTVTMKVNGTTIATVTDTSGLTVGYPGLYYVDPNGTGPSANDVMFANFSAGSGPALVSLTVTPPSATVAAGTYVQFSGTATYADGSVVNIINWSSSAASVATVDTTGLAFATGPGFVTITGAAGSDTGTANLTVNAAEGYTPLGNDSFTGTTGTYLGSKWTGCAYDGGSYSELMYENNAAGGSGYYSQDCSLYTGYGPFPNDQYATALVVAPTPSSTPEASIELRGNATPTNPESYIACGWNAQDFPADYRYRIWSLPPNPASGGPTSLYLSSLTPATNDVLWCQVLGSTVTMKVNGNTLAVVSDTSGITAGYPGLYYIDPNGDVPPNTDIIFDNFVAGQITGPVLALITITPTPASVMSGSYLQFMATGTYTDGSVGNITNSVTWSSGNPSFATISSSGLAHGVAQGSATITATSGTTTGAVNLTILPPPAPTVTFTGAPANASYNSTFTVTATTNASVMPTIAASGVCSVSAVSGAPTGASATVTMLSGTGTCMLTANWAATASYSSASKSQSTSATGAVSTASITSHSPNPSSVGQGVTVSFTVTGTGIGPTGSVTVSASTRESCTGTLNSSHSGSCVITFSSGGSRTLTARYGGDNNFNSSTSSGVSQTVNSPTVSLSSSLLYYGTVARGSTSTLSETITNRGTGALTGLTWSITGNNASEFTISSTTCGTAPATLNPGNSCVINVTFKPSATGLQSANLRLTDNASNSPQTVSLLGSGR